MNSHQNALATLSTGDRVGERVFIIREAISLVLIVNIHIINSNSPLSRMLTMAGNLNECCVRKCRCTFYSFTLTHT